MKNDIAFKLYLQTTCKPLSSIGVKSTARRAPTSSAVTTKSYIVAPELQTKYN
jgi:hypothetical protein